MDEEQAYRRSMGPRRSVPVILALAFVAATFSGADAETRRDGHHPLGGSADTSTPPGASSTVTSGNYSNDVGSADIYINTDAARAVDDFKTMAFVLMSVKTPKKRLVACAVMAADEQARVRELFTDGSVSLDRIESFAGNRAAAYALMCMNIARLMAEIEAEAPPSRATARRSTCDVVPVKIKVHTERTEDGGYRLVPDDDKFTDGAKALPLRATCTGSGTKLTMHVAPKKKGSLKKVTGPRVIVGVANPPAADRTMPVTVGFKGR